MALRNRGGRRWIIATGSTADEAQWRLDSFLALRPRGRGRPPNLRAIALVNAYLRARGPIPTSLGDHADLRRADPARWGAGEGGPELTMLWHHLRSVGAIANSLDDVRNLVQRVVRLRAQGRLA